MRAASACRAVEVAISVEIKLHHALPPGILRQELHSPVRGAQNVTKRDRWPPYVPACISQELRFRHYRANSFCLAVSERALIMLAPTLTALAQLGTRPHRINEARRTGSLAFCLMTGTFGLERCYSGLPSPFPRTRRRSSWPKSQHVGRVEVIWHEHDLGQYATIGITWDGTCDAPWDYVQNAQEALSRFNEGVNWAVIEPDESPEADAENQEGAALDRPASNSSKPHHEKAAVHWMKRLTLAFFRGEPQSTAKEAPFLTALARLSRYDVKNGSTKKNIRFRENPVTRPDGELGAWGKATQ